jgi:hypothetical protein
MGDNTVYDPELMDRVRLNNAPNSSDFRNYNNQNTLNQNSNGGSLNDSSISDLDNGGLVGDEDDDDEERLQRDLALLEVRQRLRQGRRKGIQRFTVAFCIFVLLFLIGMGITGRKGKKDAEEQQELDAAKNNPTSSGSNVDHNGNPTDHGEETNYEAAGTVLPLPPADLKSKCSLSAVETPSGIQGCESACELAECCDVPAGFALSCQTGNEVVCPQYQKYCNILHNVNSELQSAYIPEDFSTTSLSAAEATLQAEINGACMAQAIETETCVSLCREGACCWEDNLSCNNDVNCDVFASCYAMIHGSSSSGGGLPGAEGTVKEQIAVACVGTLPPASNVTSTATSDCEVLCQPALCCFNHYCSPPETMECLDYSGCYLLYQNEGTEDDDVVAAEYNNDGETDEMDAIHEACYGGSILDLLGVECSKLCEPSKCCFDSSLGDCSVVDCELYAMCNILYPVKLSATKNEIEDACKNQTTTSTGGTAAKTGSTTTLCEQVCSRGSCCFHPTETATVTGECADALDINIYCRTYTACSVVFGGASAVITTELQKACTDASTRPHCVTLCAEASCCYATKKEESCFHVNPDITCSNFKACDVLYGTTGT